MMTNVPRYNGKTLAIIGYTSAHAPDIYVVLTSYQIPELLFIYILNTCFFSESGPTIFVTVITMEY